jgi:Domain of unknown function (DUF5617)
MPKVILYEFDGTLSTFLSVGEEQRQLFFPKRTKATFDEHIRKNDHIIVCSIYSTTAEIKSALVNAEIDIAKIEIIGCEDKSNLSFREYSEEKVTKARQEVQRRKFDAAVIIDDGVVGINGNDKDIIHILVPNENPVKVPVSDSYLQAPLLPTIILQERIKPEVEKFKTTGESTGSWDLNYLSNLYLHFTNMFLFKVPTSYEKLSGSQSPLEKTGYEIGISILSDYCKNQGNSLSILGKLHRFFSGHWNRHHTDVVQELLDNTSSKATKESGVATTKFAWTAESLLKELKTKLIAAGNPLNPYGSLARRIVFLQTKLELNVIDIIDLNSEIAREKKLLPQKEQYSVNL